MLVGGCPVVLQLCTRLSRTGPILLIVPLVDRSWLVAPSQGLGEEALLVEGLLTQQQQVDSTVQLGVFCPSPRKGAFQGQNPP